MMPILDGVGMLQAMRNMEALRDIPFIIMSSMPEENVLTRIDGYAAYVRKPFELSELVKLVVTILGASRSRSR
jgi:CheY-like chemotaxis protein